VVDEGAAFGAAFDGDADRIFIVDEKGDFVCGSHLLAVLAKNALKHADRETFGASPSIAYSAVCSWLVPETIHTNGGRPVMTRVGQDSVKAGLVKTNAVFGGESSAHYNFPDTWCLDSGLFSLVDFWDMLIASGKTCSELLAELNPWPKSGEVNLRFICDDWKSVSAQVIADMKAEFDAPASDCYVFDLDGVTACHPKVDAFPAVDDLFLPDPENPGTGGIYRIVGDYTPDWWVNIRASNNEPLLRLNVESKGAPIEERTLALIKRIREISKDIARVEVQDWGELKQVTGDR
jgi:phosphomannomutase